MKLRSLYILIFIACAFAAFAASFAASPSAPPQGSRMFEIEEGEGVSEIAQRLQDEGLIRSKIGFWTYVLASGRFSHFKPGSYVLNSYSLREVVMALTLGPEEKEIVIAPGMTLKEIDERLSQERIIVSGTLITLEDTEEFKKLKQEFPFLGSSSGLEGFLMPDTYRFFQQSAPLDVARTFLSNFQRKAGTLLNGRSPANLLRTIIIASLIEKEVVSDADKQLVSGIIAKRLATDMRLQIDASVRYFSCGGRFTNCSQFTRSDFEKASPYNTYLNAGLPPAPISNPSVSSIQAALSPRGSSYLYYLTDPQTKKTIFSVTFEEHNMNRSKYLGY